MTGLAAWLSWLGATLGNGAVLRDVVLLTLRSTVGASYLLIVYQPRVSAGRAALIYLLEPIFAALFSIAWGHDQLTPRPHRVERPREEQRGEDGQAQRRNHPEARWHAGAASR